MKQQVNFPSLQVSASREAAVALEAGFVSQFLGPAAVRSGAASFSLVRGGRQDCGGPAWSALSGLPWFWFSKVSNAGGTLHTLPLPPAVLPNPLKGLPLLGKLYLYSSSMASVLICV